MSGMTPKAAHHASLPPLASRFVAVAALPWEKTRFPGIAAWIERVRAIPGWALPYDVLPGERVAPKWPI